MHASQLLQTGNAQGGGDYDLVQLPHLWWSQFSQSASLIEETSLQLQQAQWVDVPFVVAEVGLTTSVGRQITGSLAWQGKTMAIEE